MIQHTKMDNFSRAVIKVVDNKGKIALEISVILTETYQERTCSQILTKNI